MSGIIDSGNRREFGTGSVRDIADGKGMFSLVSMHAIQALSRHYENGARKYSAYNWELGQPVSEYLNSLSRHLMKLIGGAEDEDHAAAILWNTAAIIHTREMIRRGLLDPSLDDHRVMRSKDTGTQAIPKAVYLPFEAECPRVLELVEAEVERQGTAFLREAALEGWKSLEQAVLEVAGVQDAINKR